MSDESRSREQLLDEINVLKQRLAQAEAAEPRLLHLELLRRANQTLLSTRDMDQVLVTVLEEVRQALRAMSASIWLRDVDGEGLVCRHAIGPHSDRVMGWRLAAGQGIAGRVAASGESLLVADALEDSAHFTGVDATTGLQSRSIISVPVHGLEGVIGVLQALDSQPDRFSQADVVTVESLATAASLAIQMASLYEQTNELRAFNESIVQSMKEGVLIGDRSGTITFANPEATRVLGYSAEELMGKQWKDVLAPQKPDEGGDTASDWQYGHTGQYDASLITRTGSRFPVILSMRRLRFDGRPHGSNLSGAKGARTGSPEGGVVIVFTDVSRRVQSEQRYRLLARENAVLLEKARLDARVKDLLLSEVNHRVKNNLSAIVGLLYSQGQEPEFANNPILAQATQELIQRIQGLSAVHSMLSASGWEPLPLADLARQVITAVAAGMPAGKSFSVDVAPSKVRVGPDQAHHLAIILAELVTNTIKHALAGRSRVSMAVGFEVRDEQVCLRYHDDGPGPAHNAQEKTGQSSGLNLIRNIVHHSLGGTVEFRQAHGFEALITFRNVVKRSRVLEG